MKLLTNEQQNSYKNEKSAIFIKALSNINMLQIKNILKLGTIAIIQKNIEMLHIVHVN